MQQAFLFSCNLDQARPRPTCTRGRAFGRLAASAILALAAACGAGTPNAPAGAPLDDNASSESPDSYPLWPIGHYTVAPASGFHLGAGAWPDFVHPELQCAAGEPVLEAAAHEVRVAVLEDADLVTLADAVGLQPFPNFEERPTQWLEGLEPPAAEVLTTTRVFSLDAGTLTFGANVTRVQDPDCDGAPSYVGEITLGKRIVVTHTSRFHDARDAQMVRDRFPGLSLIEIMRRKEGAELLRTLSHGLASINLGIVVIGEPLETPSPLEAELSEMTSRCDDQHLEECAETLEALYALAHRHLLSRKLPTADAYDDWAIMSARLIDWTTAK